MNKLGLYGGLAALTLLAACGNDNATDAGASESAAAYSDTTTSDIGTGMAPDVVTSATDPAAGMGTATDAMGAGGAGGAGAAGAVGPAGDATQTGTTTGSPGR